ncbi:Calx-beta domain-containing protein, partial [Roseicella aquatilis]
DIEVQVNEADGFVYQTISRAGSLEGEVLITYGVTGNTATEGVDFVGGFGTVVMPDGVAEVTVPVQILDDGAASPTKIFTFSLVDVEGATLWAPRTSRVSIIDSQNPETLPGLDSYVSDYAVQQTPIATNFAFQPIRMVFSPVDATQAYVATKPGQVLMFDAETGASSVLLDISDRVNDAVDRGLLDVALHPDFVNNPYVYVFAVMDPPDAGHASGNAGLDGTGNRYAQVLRFTADAATNYTTLVPGSEVVLLGG